MSGDVLVVIGTGGSGTAIARQLGAGGTVLLGDVDPGALESTARSLIDDGLIVLAEQVDLASAGSVAGFAERAARLGPVRRVACTAGVSPEQASVQQILEVDLAGTARVLETFGEIVAPGGAGLVIASLAGHLGLHPVSATEEVALATAPVEELLALPFAAPERFRDPQSAYGFAKHANRLRVRASAARWGARGARVNSISPGIMTTPMGELELAGPFGDLIRTMAQRSPSGRLGTADDVARAAQYLLGPDADYVTGTDLLIDGGVLAAAADRRSTADASTRTGASR